MFLTSFLVLNQNSVVDIHLHDTYFVIANTHILWLLSIISLLIWTLYLLTIRILFSKFLIWAHVIITILTLVIFFTTLLFGANLFNPTQIRYSDYSDWNSFKTYAKYNQSLAIIIGMLLIGQFVFVINIIVGLTKRITVQRES